MANHYSGKRVAGRKPVGKRALSLLMALVMSLSLVQITAFAVETTGTTQKDAVVGTQGKTMTYENGKVVLSKTVEKSATGPNDFNITLEVTVKDETIQTPVSGASVVLVLDRSNSMKNNFGTVQTAAKNFAKTLLKKGGNEIAVVGFGNNYDSIPAFTTDLKVANKAIDEATQLYKNDQDGGTNIQAGVYAARKALEKAKTDNKIIVIFSDGVPTFSYKADVSGTWTGCTMKHRQHKWNDNKGTATVTTYTNFQYTRQFQEDYLAGYGDEYEYWALGNFTCSHKQTKWAWGKANNGDPAILEAGIAKDAGATIYGVYLGNDENATGTMKKVATSEKHFYSTSNLSDLAGIFGGIVEEVVATQAGTVTDPMGEYIQLGTISNITGLTATEDGLTWNVGSNFVSDENGARVYRVTYPITLLTGAEGFQEDWEYATNGKTTFSYTINNEAKTADFDVPTVKGYLPEIVPPVVTETSYTVKHQYYINNERVDNGEVTTTGKGNVGDTVTLVATDLLFEYGEKTYTDYKADPGMSIELDADASKNVIVVSYYLTEEPETETGSYSIYYQYYTNDVEDTALASWGSKTEEVGTTVNATDVPLKPVDGYGLTSITTNGQDTFTAFEVKAGGATSNSIVYVRYDRETTPEKEPSGYSVHHSYYTNGEFDGEWYDWVSEGLYVGDVIENATDVQTEYKTEFNGNEYEQTEIEGLPLTLKAEITLNVIEVRYDRTVEVEPEVRYTVLHEYYVKGADTAEARLVESFVAEPDQEVTLDSITPVTQPSKLNENLKDYTYDFVSGTPDKLTVTADGENTFVLRYERTVEVDPDPTTFEWTVKYFYRDSDTAEYVEATDEFRTGEAKDGVQLTVLAGQKSGYTFTKGDQPGVYTLSADKHDFELYYTKTSSTPNPKPDPKPNPNPPTTIDDDKTPTTPSDPGTDIEEPDVPVSPAQPPKTGDSMGLWIAAALVSGMGLVWLALSGKKREERA